MKKVQVINNIIIFVTCIVLVFVGVGLGKSFEIQEQKNSNQILEVHIYHHIEKDEVTTEMKLTDDVIKFEDSKILTEEEKINNYIKQVCKKYNNVEPELVESIVFHESRYISTVSNGNCIGLMQVSEYWHKDRATKLGVTDMYDSYGNILVGVDYLSELITKYKDVKLALMLYNMNHGTALQMYKNGEISGYAKSVLARYEMLKQEANT